MARLTNLIRRAKIENKDLAELQREAKAATPHKMGLPTTWKDSHSGTILNGKETPIVTPSGQEIQLYGAEGAKVCGGCKHFNLKAGRDKMIEQQFPDQLVEELSWKMHHLGVPPDALGLCDQDDTMLTTVISKACSHYAARSTRNEFRL
jgi:hypothetical protein